MSNNINNKFSKHYHHSNITNSIFTNVFSQQFPGLFSNDILDKKNENIINILSENHHHHHHHHYHHHLSTKNINHVTTNKLRNEPSYGIYDLFDLYDDIKIQKLKNILNSFKKDKYYTLTKKNNNNKNTTSNNNNITTHHINNNNTQNKNIKATEDKNFINKLIQNININDSEDINLNDKEKESCNLSEPWVNVENDNNKKYDIVDIRYEILLDDIINNIRNHKYKISTSITKRFKPDFSKIIGSGSNGRIFNAIDTLTSKKVALKITLSVYGSSYEEQMLKYCKSDYTVNLIDSYNDQIITVIVIDLFGIIWSPENSLINPTSHEGLDYEYYNFNNNNNKEKRINYRDLYACAKIHKYFPNTIIKSIIKQLILTINYFHTQLGVTHGDIKLQNILINEEYQIKIIDFSAMRFIKDGKVKTFSGARLFAAPEALNGDFDGRLNDIWATGVIFYFLLFGINKRIEFIKNEFQSTLVIPNSENIQEDAIDLLKQLLIYDYTKRPFIEQIINHPYLL
ncbi:kinase-like protein [Anaeromyces robustus]|uniref:Kinase-like protein n=1 Tax=Anaeromyces robustus TaxID=1754192 RepID=A0A1Y1XAE9_9FUNG|nr:kinase-like protein [Anaeromyces robustus]|eukprot:ORX82697.1 kinase-like protein [Anaeromyces robustus]